MDGYRWYAKYIAELASTAAPPSEDPPWFSLYNSDATGRLVIADTEIAPIFLAAVTLCISLFISLLLARIPRWLAVAWSFGFLLQQRRLAQSSISQNEKPPARRGSWHLPLTLANCGLFLSDALDAVFASFHHLRRMELFRAFLYLLFGLFCVVGAVLGPVVALLVSRDVVYGFAGATSGPCLGQFNFTWYSTNRVAQGLDHHMRSYELLPWAQTFNYSWADNNTVYSTGQPVQEPISKVVYEQLDGCILNDDVLCDARFPRTHKVSVNLPPSRLGLWYDDSWSLKLTGHCLRLNSTSISNRTGPTSYVYGLHYAPGARRADPIEGYECPYSRDTLDSWSLGQGEGQRFDRRKNIITDSFFVNQEEDIGYPCHKWRDSVRNLVSDSLTIISVLPPRDDINQLEGDELYLEPVSTNRNFNYTPSQVAHLLCWEDLYVETKSGESFKTSAVWANRSAAIAQHKLPVGLNALLHMASTEFLVKPARFLRGSFSLLQSVAETPAWEFNPENAPPVPFAAEVHRWAHIGAMDIASKATRSATGFYGRGNMTALAVAEAEGPLNEEMRDLCNAVRATREGTVTLPLRVLVALAVLLGVALGWWILERLGVALASWGFAGPGGVIRSFLMLPAATPVSLAVSAETAILAAMGWGSEPSEQVVGSASGQPYIKSIGPSVGGPGMSPGRDDKWILSWGFSGFSAVGNKRAKIQ